MHREEKLQQMNRSIDKHQTIDESTCFMTDVRDSSSISEGRKSAKPP